MSKVLEVTLEGPTGMTWVETYENIAAARVKHYAEVNEFKEGTPEYKRLMEISLTDAQVFDWARRFLCPEPIRRSWHLCKRTVKDTDGKVISGITTPKAAPDPRVATLEAENAKLREALAKAGKGKDKP